MSSVIREKTGRSSEFSDVLQLIETIVVPGDTDSVSFTGLDGDLDGKYVIDAQIIAGNNNGEFIKLRVNGSDANLSATYSVNTGVIEVYATQAFALIGENGGVGTTTLCMAKLFGKSGAPTRGGKFASNRGVGAINHSWYGVMSYNDAATKITSLQVAIDAGVGNGIKAGSIISLYKIKQ